MDNTCAIFDGENYSVCYNKFITLKYLPCKHSFYHSLILISCPICHIYIAERDTDNPEDWAKCFPENIVRKKNVYTILINDSVNPVYVRATKKTQHSFVLIATKKYERTAQNATTEDH